MDCLSTNAVEIYTNPSADRRHPLDLMAMKRRPRAVVLESSL